MGQHPRAIGKQWSHQVTRQQPFTRCTKHLTFGLPQNHAAAHLSESYTKNLTFRAPLLSLL